jgi:hypothetical protein
LRVTNTGGREEWLEEEIHLLSAAIESGPHQYISTLVVAKS